MNETREPNVMVRDTYIKYLERRVKELSNEGNVMTREQAKFMVDDLSFEYEEGDTSRAWGENFRLWLESHLVRSNESYRTWVGDNEYKASRRII